MLSQLGGYRILDEVGRGAMGVVYRALDPVLQRTVAIKTIQTGGGQSTSNLRERFLREARSSASLSHPNIVGIHHMAKYEGYVYIVMEFV